MTDEEWAVIKPLIPLPSGMGRPCELDLREVFNAIQYILGTGCQWRANPKCFPTFESVQNHFYASRDNSVLERMLDAQCTLAREPKDRAAEPMPAAVDSQSVKTTEMGGPSEYDAGKRIKGRKRRVMVDA
ncbi:MAG: transposase [Boseongicola sp.]|nr:transposase [Boseongicola sp.]